MNSRLHNMKIKNSPNKVFLDIRHHISLQGSCSNPAFGSGGCFSLCKRYNLNIAGCYSGVAGSCWEVTTVKQTYNNNGGYQGDCVHDSLYVAVYHSVKIRLLKAARTGECGKLYFTVQMTKPQLDAAGEYANVSKCGPTL